MEYLNNATNDLWLERIQGLIIDMNYLSSFTNTLRLGAEVLLGIDGMSSTYVHTATVHPRSVPRQIKHIISNVDGIQQSWIRSTTVLYSEYSTPGSNLQTCETYRDATHPLTIVKK